MIGRTKIKTLLKYLTPIIIILLLACIYFVVPATCAFVSNEEDEMLKAEIGKLYNTRNKAFISGDLNSLSPLFNSSKKPGLWSLEHEVRRVKYLKDWSNKRGVKFINIESTVRLKKILRRTPTIKMAIEESYKFDYIYPNDENPVVNSFGVGIRHTLSLIKIDDKYIIYSDWYTDCFEDAMQAYSGDIGSGVAPSDEDKDLEAFTSNITATNVVTTNIAAVKYTYNRQKAIDYADKYCGAAWGSTNNFKYNKKYADYNGIGGDCTNFASQCLGDKEAGGLRPDGTWQCSGPKNGRCSGSRAWVNVDGLKNYLLYSGKGSQIAVGTYKDLTIATESKPTPAITKLKPGDMICYIKKGNPDHFAIVTAIDSHGYPLVNSHTTDRYHVPWDLGWGDKHIKFCLIHING